MPGISGGDGLRVVAITYERLLCRQGLRIPESHSANSEEHKSQNKVQCQDGAFWEGQDSALEQRFSTFLTVLRCDPLTQVLMLR